MSRVQGWALGRSEGSLVLLPQELPSPCRCACRATIHREPTGPCDPKAEVLDFMGIIPPADKQARALPSCGRAGGSLSPCAALRSESMSIAMLAQAIWWRKSRVASRSLVSRGKEAWSPRRRARPQRLLIINLPAVGHEVREVHLGRASPSGRASRSSCSSQILPSLAELIYRVLCDGRAPLP